MSEKVKNNKDQTNYTSENVTNLERTTFELILTDGTSVVVEGTRLIRPSDRDGLLVVDDIKARDAGIEIDRDTDSCIVAAVPNATLKIAYDVEKEPQEEWMDDEVPV